MKYLFNKLIKFCVTIVIGVWDFVFFFFGMPYEKQAGKLKLDEYDEIIRGPVNEKTSHKSYRANRVSKAEGSK